MGKWFRANDGLVIFALVGGMLGFGMYADLQHTILGAALGIVFVIVVTVAVELL